MALTDLPLRFLYRPLVYSSQLTNRSSRVKLHKTMEVSVRPGRGERSITTPRSALTPNTGAQGSGEIHRETRHGESGNGGYRRLPPVHLYSKAHNFSHRSCRRNEPDH